MKTPLYGWMKRRIGEDNEGHKVRGRTLTQKGFAGGQHGASRVTLQTQISKQTGMICRNYVPDARRELSAILAAIVVVVVVVRWPEQAENHTLGFFRLLFTRY
jgi:hypothetical protein